MKAVLNLECISHQLAGLIQAITNDDFVKRNYVSTCLQYFYLSR
jgi:hypothetical protein